MNCTPELYNSPHINIKQNFRWRKCENVFNKQWLHIAVAGLAALVVVAGVRGVDGVSGLVWGLS